MKITLKYRLAHRKILILGLPTHCRNYKVYKIMYCRNKVLMDSAKNEDMFLKSGNTV